MLDDDAEEMEGVGVVGVFGEDLAVDGLGDDRAGHGLMLAERQVERRVRWTWWHSNAGGLLISPWSRSKGRKN